MRLEPPTIARRTWDMASGISYETRPRQGTLAKVDSTGSALPMGTTNDLCGVCCLEARQGCRETAWVVLDSVFQCLGRLQRLGEALTPQDRTDHRCRPERRKTTNPRHRTKKTSWNRIRNLKFLAANSPSGLFVVSMCGAQVWCSPDLLETRTRTVLVQ